MVTFVSASVTPDSLLYALWGLAFWLGARLIDPPGATGDIVAICAMAALAVLTKATSYALLPAVAIAVIRRRCGPAEAHAGSRAAGGGGGHIRRGGRPWYVIARLEDRPASGQLAGSAPASDVNYREFGSYVWQYYLPRLPFQARYGALGDTHRRTRPGSSSQWGHSAGSDTWPGRSMPRYS